MPGGGADPIGGVATIYLGSYDRINWGYERRDERLNLQVETAYIDEESKININKADRKVLEKLFEVAAEMDTDSAADLACCIIDWRDKDSFHQHPQYGAEDGFYENAERPYGAKDASFEALDELLLVKGMSRDVYDKVRNYLTIWGKGKVNVNNAAGDVLRALGLGESVTGKIVSYRLRYNPAEEKWISVRFQDVNSIIPALKSLGPLTKLEEIEITGMLPKAATVSEYFAVRSVGELSDEALCCQVVSVVSVHDGDIRFWREEVGTAESVQFWKARGE